MALMTECYQGGDWRHQTPVMGLLFQIAQCIGIELH